MSKFILHKNDGLSEVMEIGGRQEWALRRLIAAGADGCTPIDTPGPRWSGYVHKLRGRGIAIKTIAEPHGGEYSGHHARYVLVSHIEALEAA